jgi:hypothetical protein
LHGRERVAFIPAQLARHPGAEDTGRGQPPHERLQKSACYLDLIAERASLREQPAHTF